MLILEPSGARPSFDPYLPSRPELPAPSPGARPEPPREATAATASVVPRRLARLRAAGSLSPAAYAQALAVWRSAMATERHLHGAAADELGAVIANTSEMARAGELTASRVAPVFVTLLRNRQWWSIGSPLAAGDRVEFAGSQAVWEFYPGQGLQFQVLGSFGKADGLYTAGPSHYAQMLSLVDELVGMASRRRGMLSWEYLFHFGGGSPPWISAMSQATALEALTRAASAARLLGEPGPAATYMALAHQAVGILQTPPPLGVALPAAHGTWFLLYSFAPGAWVINAFLQTLIGLYDYGHASGDRRALALFASGDAEAEAELPAFDTGAWSLYQPGQESSLAYHELVTGFAQQLCQRTAAAVYCTTAAHFARYLTQAPVVSAPPISSTPAIAARVPITLSKISTLSLQVLDRGGKSRFDWSSELAYGRHDILLPRLTAGRYTITLRAVDLAGNVGQGTAPMVVEPPSRPRKPSRGGVKGRGAGRAIDSPR